MTRGTNPPHPARKRTATTSLTGTHSIFHRVRSGIKTDTSRFASTPEKTQSYHDANAYVSFSSPAHVACDSLNLSARHWVPAAFSVSSQQMLLWEGPSSILADLKPRELGRAHKAALQQTARRLGSLEGE